MARSGGVASVGEHRADQTIQIGGLVCAAAAAILLIRLAWGRAEPGALPACAVYGLALVAMFACSLFNANAPDRLKPFARLLDHCVIYLLIAGTYTPFCLLMIGGTEGVLLLGLAWGFALAGIGLRLAHRARRVGIALYVLLGWIGLVRIDAVIERLPTLGLALLAAGGVIYTLGAPIHRLTHWRYHDAIWHGSVVAAAGCHMVAVMAWLAA